PAPPPCDNCASDADCATRGPNYICALQTCQSCMSCTPGCQSNSDCDAGQTCGSNHHCAPATCMTNGDCPEFFSCGSGTCSRSPCSSDSNCPGGACVNGLCYPAPGMCEALPI